MPCHAMPCHATPYQVLDTWMGLFYVPAITNAAKRKQEDGGKRRKKLPKAKPSLFGNTEVRASK